MIIFLRIEADDRVKNKSKNNFIYKKKLQNYPKKMRWGETETCIFSKIYISHACLWNPEHTYYKMRNKRLHAYREIMAQFYDATGIKLNEIEVKLKIKNLRSTYLQEIQKIKQRSNEEWTYRPALKWFYDWYKCLSTIKKGDSDMSLDISRDFTDANDNEDICGDVWASPPCNINGHSDPIPESDDFKLLILKPEPNDSSSEKRGSNSYKIKKKKMKRQRHPSTDDSDKTFGTYRGSLDSSMESTKDDEFDIYGKYIATQLRKMDLQKALRVQVEIQSLVSEARISDLNDK